MAFFKRKNKTNWERLQAQTPEESKRYRDVYESQQFERSEMDDLQSPTSRMVLTIIATILVMVCTWVLVSIGEFGTAQIKEFAGGVGSSIAENIPTEEAPSYYTEVVIGGSEGSWVKLTAYQAVDEYGVPFGPQYDSPDLVPIPDWYFAQVQAEGMAGSESEALASAEVMALTDWLKPTLLKILITLLVGLGFFTFFRKIMMKNLEAQNLLNRVDDINQYENDQHIALPEEVMAKFDFFPDVGAHSNVQVSSLISHVALSNKGVKPIDVAQRADEDIYDEDGDLLFHKGEALLDDNGDLVTKSKPLFDTDFAHDLFQASGVPKEKSLRKFFDPAKIDYNKDNQDREKLKGYDTVADLVNNDWTFPDYEVQRPGGAYVVDTNPVNTMVLAMTVRRVFCRKLQKVVFNKLLTDNLSIGMIG